MTYLAPASTLDGIEPAAVSPVNERARVERAGVGRRPARLPGWKSPALESREGRTAFSSPVPTLLISEPLPLSR